MTRVSRIFTISPGEFIQIRDFGHLIELYNSVLTPLSTWSKFWPYL